MGFLDMFKKKEESQAELELPPLPPLDNEPQNMQLPELPDFPQDTQPSPQELELPELPDFSIDAPTQDLPELPPMFAVEPVPQKQLPQAQNTQVSEVVDGPLFINVETFNTIVEELNDMQSLINQAQINCTKMHNTPTDQAMQSIDKSAQDMYKKLTLIDKILFER